MGLVHLPPFVGRRGEASREQDSFVLAETGHFSQKLFHALAFFFHLKKGYASGIGESTERATFRLFLISKPSARVPLAAGR